MQRPILINNVCIATMVPGQGDYGLISDGAIAIDRANILWAGKQSECPDAYAHFERLGYDGRLVTPGLIDCHTHIVHGGNRSNEFEMRLNGASYEEISLAGGGIASTVSATRLETEDNLLTLALKRVDGLIAQGVSTIEIKSGYGLDCDTELKMLRVARQIETLRSVRIVTTFLGAHAVPSGMDEDHYIDTVCIPTLKKAHEQGLVDAVDGFCENIAFNTDQISRIFDAARQLGLPVKLHAEQLSRAGGASLASCYHALSADHLEYASKEDVAAMAKAGTVAVLLPGAFYTLGETQMPPIAAFRSQGVAMAVATDWNPGSSPLGSLLLAMNMACTLFHLTPHEALAGTTCVAASALGLSDRGMIKAGLRADLAIWDVESPAELSYNIGSNPLHARVYGGQL